MGTSFGVGGIGDYHFGNHYEFLGKLLILPSKYHDDNSYQDENGLKCLSGLKGFEAIPVIKDFFYKCYHYQLHSHDRTLQEDFGSEVVVSCMYYLGLLMADCIEQPYEEIHVTWV